MPKQPEFQWWEITINWKIPVNGESQTKRHIKDEDLIPFLEQLAQKRLNIENYQVFPVMLPKDPEHKQSDNLDS